MAARAYSGLTAVFLIIALRRLNLRSAATRLNFVSGIHLTRWLFGGLLWLDFSFTWLVGEFTWLLIWIDATVASFSFQQFSLARRCLNMFRRRAADTGSIRLIGCFFRIDSSLF